MEHPFLAEPQHPCTQVPMDALGIPSKPATTCGVTQSSPEPPKKIHGQPPHETSEYLPDASSPTTHFYFPTFLDQLTGGKDVVTRFTHKSRQLD